MYSCCTSMCFGCACLSYVGVCTVCTLLFVLWSSYLSLLFTWKFLILVDAYKLKTHVASSCSIATSIDLYSKEKKVNVCFFNEYVDFFWENVCRKTFTMYLWYLNNIVDIVSNGNAHNCLMAIYLTSKWSDL